MIPDVCSWMHQFGLITRNWASCSTAFLLLACEHRVFCFHYVPPYWTEPLEIICLAFRLSTCYGSARRRGRIPLELYTFICCYNLTSDIEAKYSSTLIGIIRKKCWLQWSSGLYVTLTILSLTSTLCILEIDNCLYTYWSVSTRLNLLTGFNEFMKY